MRQQRSFVPSDFSLRDIPFFLVAYVLISVLCVALGLVLHRLPLFYSGLLFGLGLGLLLAFVVLQRLVPSKTIDVDSLPKLSESVAKICDAKGYRCAEAAVAYCKETGLGLTEATAAIDAYLSQKQVTRSTSRPKNT